MDAEKYANLSVLQYRIANIAMQLDDIADCFETEGFDRGQLYSMRAQDNAQDASEWLEQHLKHHKPEPTV